MEVDLSAYPAEDVARARAWPKVGSILRSSIFSSFLITTLLIVMLSLLYLTSLPHRCLLTLLYSAPPQVELHLHLDGSLSPAFIARRAAARGIELPAPEER